METRQPKRRRNRTISFRMTEEEYLIVQQKISDSGLTQQAYIIAALQNLKISSNNMEVQKETNAILNNLTLQLRRIGININQLAYVANAQGKLSVLNELSEFAEEVNKYRKETEEKWQLIRSLMVQKALTEH